MTFTKPVLSVPLRYGVSASDGIGMFTHCDDFEFAGVSRDDLAKRIRAFVPTAKSCRGKTKLRCVRLAKKSSG